MANILVVDDEIGIRELLSEILGDEGHVVQLAENAAEARIQLIAEVPDLVLLDIWMPDTDGVSLLKEWSSSGQLSMPVIMMSGHATIDTAVEATRIGALDFLEKPIALQKLLRAVQRGLYRLKPVQASTLVAHHVHNERYAGAVHGGTTTANHSSQNEVAHHGVGSTGLNGVATANGATVGREGRAFERDTLDLPLREARDVFERTYFEHHLQRENGSMTRVAEKTGLERTHLYRKLKQLGIELAKAVRK